jgi:hypothetical protein
VKNDYDQSRTCTLQTTITGKNNEIVQVIRTEALIGAGQLYMFDQSGKVVKNPHLWTVEDPYLYTLKSEVIDRKESIDSFTSSFGFRWFRKDKNDNSMYLNDKKIELAGVNRHQEYPWLGDAVPEWMTETDYSEIAGKSGYNFIRTINYPGDKASYEQADKQGIITEEDFSAIARHGFSEEDQKQQIREMIRRDRNHPGIVSWSIGNENVESANSKFVDSEDTTRKIGSIIVLIDSSFTSFGTGTKKDLSPGDSLNGREPAKIIVRSSHKSFAADRGSVVIITADVTDSKGNHLPGAKNNIMWKVSGPARLAGPAYYVSYADSNKKSGEGWYIEMPAANILRSTGKPGEITVTAFSGGLASGSCVIDAEEIKTDNSFVTEPILADQGRKPVVRSALVVARLDEIPQEIAPTTQDFNLSQMDKKGYARMIGDYIYKNNPLTDTLLAEFKTLTDLLARQLYNNGGNLSAADYNFNIEHYNNCRLISGYIARTKLPPLFKESLREYYSKVIIGQSTEKNAGEEMNWLNWIPSGGTVVIVQDETTNTGQKGVVFTKKTALPDIIKVIYPQFAKFSTDARERALIFISKMNPCVHIKYSNGGSITRQMDPINDVEYIAEKGQSILIPEYKFISE